MASDYGLKDFLFGAGPLKKAAGDKQGSTQSSLPEDMANASRKIKASLPSTSQPSGIDMGKLAQDAADRALGKSPLSSTMTPVSKKGK
jgi:hypothetical protein